MEDIKSLVLTFYIFFILMVKFIKLTKERTDNYIMSKITFQYIATEDNTSTIPILENVIDFDLTENNIIVLYNGIELKNKENYIIDINNKILNLKDWSINKNDELLYRIEI